MQVCWKRRRNSPESGTSLAELFDGRSQLLVYHFMLGPGWGEGCPSCSFWADHFNGLTHHLPQRDVTFKVISRAALKDIQKYQKRMGWSFDWVSSSESTFNLDLGVSSGKDDESPGISIFAREETMSFIPTLLPVVALRC